MGMDQNTTSSTPRTGPRASRSRWWGAAALLATTSLLLGCGGGGGGGTAEEAPAVAATAALASIAVTPSDPKVGVGLTQTLAAQARDQYGAVMSGVPLTWTSSNPAVATVVDGVVRGVPAGQASITASSGGVTSTPGCSPRPRSPAAASSSTRRRSFSPRAARPPAFRRAS